MKFVRIMLKILIFVLLTKSYSLSRHHAMLYSVAFLFLYGLFYEKFIGSWYHVIIVDDGDVVSIVDRPRDLMFS